MMGGRRGGKRHRMLQETFYHDGLWYSVSWPVVGKGVTPKGATVDRELKELFLRLEKIPVDRAKKSEVCLSHQQTEATI